MTAILDVLDVPVDTGSEYLVEGPSYFYVLCTRTRLACVEYTCATAVVLILGRWILGFFVLKFEE